MLFQKYKDRSREGPPLSVADHSCGACACSEHGYSGCYLVSHQNDPMSIMERLEKQGLDPQSTSTHFNAELGIGTIG